MHFQIPHHSQNAITLAKREGNWHIVRPSKHLELLSHDLQIPDYLENILHSNISFPGLPAFHSEDLSGAGAFQLMPFCSMLSRFSELKPPFTKNITNKHIS